MKSGQKQWAQGIEDDIDAAVEHVMRRPEIDGERICIIGGSYGGFSALASAIRHESRYRCAVTINGVTDVPLLADSSDTADSRRALAQLEEIVGDIETEKEKLLAISPVYHAKKIRVPVLVIQGNADIRVDPDHAHRLVAMLKLYGKDHETLFIDGAGHSFDRAQWITVRRRVRKFLTDHLQPGIMYRFDPESDREKRRSTLPNA